MIGKLLATVIGQGLDSVRYWLETLNNSRGDEIGSLLLNFCQHGIATLTFHQRYNCILVALADQRIDLPVPDLTTLFNMPWALTNRSSEVAPVVWTVPRGF